MTDETQGEKEVQLLHHALLTSALRTSDGQTQAQRTPPAQTQCHTHLVHGQEGDGRLGSSTPPSQCAAWTEAPPRDTECDVTEG